jgi:leucyl-tRNA synthetase
MGMRDYDPNKIESKWQREWTDGEAFRTDHPSEGETTFYCLEMLPYPSGKLHMGHVRNYSIGDAVARFERMRGRRVMHVIGWDAFGMPAENAAIRHGENPKTWTRRNIESMRAQLQRLGTSYDWEREISTCDPSYYRWNQWFFLKMLEHDLAYRARRRLNWCEHCETVLANEQVVDGRCWRCDGAVRLREFEQWFLRITNYAQELLDDLDRMEGWPDKVRTMQRNWIGRSEGARVYFAVDGSGARIEVFTTRIDTIFGATYVALAAEHPAIAELVRGNPEESAVTGFVDEQLARNLEERFAEGAEKSGVFTGRYAINPFSGERLPIWVANFVLMDVGSGAIMCVPGHDQRDFDFAKAYGLSIRPVIHPLEGERLDAGALDAAFTEPGRLGDSGQYSDLPSAEATARMVADAEREGFGKAEITYRLKDWGISRQRFWGTPIPVVHCAACGAVGLPADRLPVVLPDDAPLTGEGGSPLARVEEFFQTECPQCGGPARRDTDTMDTFVDSSWYYFRYLDAQNTHAPFDRAAQAPWMPVDLYIGGIEHATMHLIYTRFWTKMMRDLGLVEVDEPVDRLFTQGMVVKDGAKMSKSKGNVVEPDRLIDRYGADTTRLFCLFAAPPEKDLEWSESGVEGCHRFLKRVWRTFAKAEHLIPSRDGAGEAGPFPEEAQTLRRKTHDTIRRVTDDLSKRMRLNTAVAAIMELINTAAPLVERDDLDAATLSALREAFEVLAKVLAPLAPHFAEELWHRLGHDTLVSVAPWPEADPRLLVHDEVTLVVQVNGKLRGRIRVPRGCTEQTALESARLEQNVAANMEGKTLRRIIHVPDRLLNLVVS